MFTKDLPEWDTEPIRRKNLNRLDSFLYEIAKYVATLYKPFVYWKAF